MVLNPPKKWVSVVTRNCYCYPYFPVLIEAYDLQMIEIFNLGHDYRACLDVG